MHILKTKIPSMVVNSYIIGLIPDEQTASQAVEYSQYLTQQIDSYFSLNTKDFLPHVTLYGLGLEEAKLNQIDKFLGQITGQISAFELDFLAFELYDSYYMLNLAKNTIITNLQSQILDQVSPLRERSYVAPEYLQDMEPEAYDKWEKYGSVWIGDSYNPHITLTKFKSSTDDTLQQIPKSKMIFSAVKFKSIGLFLSADHGTAKQLIREYNLL